MASSQTDKTTSVTQRMVAQPGTNGLNGTMSGQNIAAPNVNPNDADMQPYDQAIQDAETKLNGLLNEYPSVDYQSKYQELMNDVQNQPVAQNPLSTNAGIAANFGYALGAPNTAPSLIHEKILQSQHDADTKQAASQRLKEMLLQGDIQQQIQKGNFGLAIKQNEALSELQRANQDRERALNMQDWLNKQKVKTQDAQTLLQNKIRLITAGFHLPEKARLAMIQMGGKLLQEKLRQKTLLGEPVWDMDTGDMIDEIMPDIYRYAMSQNPGKEVTPPPGSASTKTPPTSANPAQAALDRIRAARKAQAQGKK